MAAAELIIISISMTTIMSTSIMITTSILN